MNLDTETLVYIVVAAPLLPFVFYHFYRNVIIPSVALSGWTPLAKKYTADNLQGLRWELAYNCTIGSGEFSPIEIAGDSHYFYLKCEETVKSFNPPLMIPWSQIDSIKTPLLSASYDIQIKDPSVRMFINKKAFDKICPKAVYQALKHR